MSGANVVPIVHGHYDGRDIALPDDPTAVLRLADNPALAGQIGHDIVTASGTMLHVRGPVSIRRGDEVRLHVPVERTLVYPAE